jgi:hypothetical protein
MARTYKDARAVKDARRMQDGGKKTRETDTARCNVRAELRKFRTAR